MDIRSSKGQALLELVVGLVALVVLVAGILQVASLTKAQTDTMQEARANAARNAFGDAGYASIPEYILDIGAGPDGRTYSYDDTHTLGGGGPFHNVIISKAASDQAGWDILQQAHNKNFSALNNSGNPVQMFGLIKGSASTTVEIQPAVHDLIYGADQIEVKSDIWTTWTRGVY